LVDALAPHLAMVVRADALTTALAEQQQRTTRATLAERDRLRRDLHDGLGPSLSGIALGLEAATGVLHTDPASAETILERTRVEADAAVREVRRVLDALRPSVLDELGLAGAVRRTASGLGLGRPGGTRFGLEASGVDGLPPHVEEAAFRIVAESLTNVARHACARSCTVRLIREAGALRLGVHDDGAGLLGTGAGHGLDSMRRRAADLGGWLAVRPAEPRGTVVDAVLPWTAS
jgi:signal transduction histidine kinase